MKNKYKAVIFDLDGTLIDTLGDIGASANKALKMGGYPEHNIEDYREMVGWGLKRLAFLSLPEEDRSEKNTAEVFEALEKFYREEPLVYTKAYPGMTELVSILVQRKIKTVVLTNKPDPVAQLIIANLFPLHSFDIVKGELSGTPRKPDPASVWDILVDLDLTPAEVIFAGDSEIDIETAVTSGCFPLGVSWGYRSRETIIKAGAKKIIDIPEELLSML